MKIKGLTLRALKKQLRDQRDTGGLIYIKNTDQNDRPLNFHVRGSNATSGAWRHGLTGRPINWVLIYQFIDSNSGLVRIGGYVRSAPLLGQKFEIQMNNVTAPLKVKMSVGELTGKRAPENPVYLSVGRERDPEGISDLFDLAGLTGLTTEKQQLILARLGQGKFRQRVLKLWDGACAVTGIRTLAAIRASHIIPWSACTDSKTKLNPENGLPLLATLDALFDKGLISFDSDGTMLVSHKVQNKERKTLGVPTNLIRKPSTIQQHFLEHHRSEVFIE